MKIVFIAIKGIEKIGGIETYTFEAGKRLAKMGHDIVIYTLKNEQHSKTYEFEGMTIIPLSAFRNSPLAKLFLVIHASFHQFSLKHVDVVHYHAIGPSLFCFIPRIAGRKTVVQSHGHEWKRSSWGWLAVKFFHFAEKYSFVFANQITSVSQELKEFYEKKYNREVHYIPNGVNLAKPRKAKEIKKFNVKENNYILFLGRISREKGIHYLIEAYQRINTSMPLVIVGEQREGDKYLAELKMIADDNPNILFTGTATGKLWREWYSNAAIFVLPSEIEGLPTSLLEAMSFARCCLISDIAANCEALGNTGAIFKNTDVDSLFHALEYLIHNPEVRTRYGKLAKIRADTVYAWDNISLELEDFYNNLITNKHPDLPIIG